MAPTLECSRGCVCVIVRTGTLWRVEWWLRRSLLVIGTSPSITKNGGGWWLTVTGFYGTN
jgi:hypothetical protein